MALSRRTGTRFQASIWPGFVDAMTGLLLVLMFVQVLLNTLRMIPNTAIHAQKIVIQVSQQRPLW